jgi:hypothetical protein
MDHLGGGEVGLPWRFNNDTAMDMLPQFQSTSNHSTTSNLNSDQSNTSPSTSDHSIPNHRVPTKAVRRGQRVLIDRSHLQSLCDSPTSPLDFNCRKLLAYILDSHYYLFDLPEPKLGTEEGTNILRHLAEEQGVTFPPNQVKPGTPLSALLTDPTQPKCLICQKKKTTAQRAVECVRSHIGHRPFRCGGSSQGCPTCRPGQE